ncbi:MAG: START domain-containing protein [Bacteroidia bacterium]
MIQCSHFLYLTIVFLMIPAYSHSQADWELRKNSDDIQVYFRSSDDSDIKELKITTTLDCTLSSAISVINDIEKMPEWVYQCEEAEFIGKNEGAAFTFVNRTVVPFFFKDREIVLQCTTFQERPSLKTCSRCVARPDALALNPDYIRVEKAISEWTFWPQEDGTLKVEYFFIADPGGYVPAWLINFALDYGPVNTLKQFKKRVHLEEYAKARLTYIQDH